MCAQLMHLMLLQIMHRLEQGLALGQPCPEFPIIKS